MCVFSILGVALEFARVMLCYIRTQSLLNTLIGDAMILSAVKTEASVEDVEE